ncbi:4Fe-4S ferredoxin, iron-sulfur binding domain protein [Thermosinus carboxydivorans Nor1]|uniref:4Fe-4S ferredoxin, iron-sulfur binding domain protein n=1 Tax=Thermosinus carboxydivorans Nor1 TaxID=401526 RepID=A1HNC1_9FIRM|nr:4Fe-4S dicluster domain-containing protein [Thermosinus carboxydivorans]EAX48285.1 4Fe-4S ferredoxin, iron-sulfur binding domain protein [Thermosinus carboxydivorans Nor1]
MARYGMVIDLRRCVGCYACVMACKAENATPPGVFWNKVYVKETGQYPNARMTFLPVLCNHCANPPCLAVCPTGATYKRPDGIVALDAGKCMGCGYCVVACPYQQRVITEIKPYYPKHGLTPLEQHGYKKHRSGTATKCTFCLHRLEQGKQPACVVACPGRARIFGDLDDPQSEVAKLLGSSYTTRLMENMGTRPAVYYIPD